MVVILALGALVLCTCLVLDHFESTTCEKTCVEERTQGEPGVGIDNSTASASSVVAVMSPVIAAILGIAGLFFGLSATGSAKAKKAESDKQIAASNAEAQIAAHETAQMALSKLPTR